MEDKDLKLSVSIWENDVLISKKVVRVTKELLNMKEGAFTLGHQFEKLSSQVVSEALSKNK